MDEEIKFVVTKENYRIVIGNESYSSKSIENIMDYLCVRLSSDKVAYICEELLKIINM